MSEVQIIGNGHFRELIYGFALPDEVKSDYDYLETEELENSQFFQYRGQWYYLGDFISPRSIWLSIPDSHPFSKFDGYNTDSYFSAILIKFSNCREGVAVYTAIK